LKSELGWMLDPGGGRIVKGLADEDGVDGEDEDGGVVVGEDEDW